jgi:hypothetical protein
VASVFDLTFAILLVCPSVDLCLSIFDPFLVSSLSTLFAVSIVGFLSNRRKKKNANGRYQDGQMDFFFFKLKKKSEIKFLRIKTQRE